MDSVATSFYRLTPDRVLDAVESTGQRVTGRCSALGSLENRVYDVELDDGPHVIAKFYRPTRWSRDTIADEHRMLQALAAQEIRTCPPIADAEGQTLWQIDGIYFALFPRIGGRCPDELSPAELEELGRLTAQMHNVGAAARLHHRPAIDADSYGEESLRLVREHASLAPVPAQRLETVARELIALARQRLAGAATTTVHGDLHRANLLRTEAGFCLLDFDDMGRAPAVQDLWLLLPGRPTDCPDHVEAFLRGYELFRDFDRSSLALIEVLRGLRYLRHAGWIASRWADPSFQRAFPTWGSERYWQEQVSDLYEQIELIRGG
jgi:Ser/Thr protein kinase RdoA (MazF antagonist)